MTRARRRRRAAAGAVVCAAAAAIAWWHLAGPEGSQPTIGAVVTVGAEVVRVVDGDTLIVNQDGAEVRVRLLGIDTPESVKPDSPVECYGPEASARTTELASGRIVRLEGDPTQDAVDQYGRTLAYVWLDDATMLNEVLVAEGYAREYTYEQPGSHQALLLDAQRRAQAADAGLWSACTDHS